MKNGDISNERPTAILLEMEEIFVKRVERPKPLAVAAWLSWTFGAQTPPKFRTVPAGLFVANQLRKQGVHVFAVRVGGSKKDNELILNTLQDAPIRALFADDAEDVAGIIAQEGINYAFFSSLSEEDFKTVRDFCSPMAQVRRYNGTFSNLCSEILAAQIIRSWGTPVEGM